MKSNGRKMESDAELERMAHNTNDIVPMTPAVRRRWEAAKTTGARVARKRSRKAARDASRIVPVSIDAELLERVDRYASDSGISRSKLVVEGLRMRLKGSKRGTAGT